MRKVQQSGLRPDSRGEPCLSVIIPCYNEENTLACILQRVLVQPFDMEVIVVDDGSTDETPSILAQIAAQDARIRVLRHKSNRGKGAAIRTAIPLCRGRLVLIQDADLEYAPEDYAVLLEPLAFSRADMVLGSRFVTTRARRVLYYWHSVANRLLTWLSNMVANINLTDMETCYKVFRREVIQAIDLKESGFGFEPEVTIKVARMGCRIYEVGISYSGRTYQEGKKIRAKDGVWALWCILKYGLTANSQICPSPRAYKEDAMSLREVFREKPGWPV